MIPSLSQSASEQVQQLAAGYLRRTSMARADFARRVGYAPSTMGLFLTGKYQRDDQALCAAVLKYLEANPAATASEFSGTLYEIGNVRAMRSLFDQLSEKKCILMCYAPPGSGKTDVARALISEYNRAAGRTRMFRVYCREGIRPRDLMGRVAMACGWNPDAQIDRILGNLRQDFQGVQVVVYFDESQHLSPECLETVRELFDELDWSLCFAGSHDLDRVFQKFAGSLEQLERRIVDKVELPPVTTDEAAGIIRTELPRLAPAQVRTLIEQSTVEIRVRKKAQRYISIGRIMAAIGATQKQFPELADEPGQAARKVEAIA